MFVNYRVRFGFGSDPDEYMSQAFEVTECQRSLSIMQLIPNLLERHTVQLMYRLLKKYCSMNYPIMQSQIKYHYKDLFFTINMLKLYHSMNPRQKDTIQYIYFYKIYCSMNYQIMKSQNIFTKYVLNCIIP